MSIPFFYFLHVQFNGSANSFKLHTLHSISHLRIKSTFLLAVQLPIYLWLNWNQKHQKNMN